MSLARSFINLVAMRRRAGGSWIKSARWAAELLLNSYRTSQRRRPLERRAEVERAARQRL